MFYTLTLFLLPRAQPETTAALQRIITELLKRSRRRAQVIDIDEDETEAEEDRREAECLGVTASVDAPSFPETPPASAAPRRAQLSRCVVKGSWDC